ncbi:hypothetical protein TNCV_4260951 [Trichonephila clavipes]|nr:hypothetical protein TNCV_4260951 [Trichonephila clavipes]
MIRLVCRTTFSNVRSNWERKLLVCEWHRIVISNPLCNRTPDVRRRRLHSRLSNSPSRLKAGPGSIMVKVTDSWMERHEFETNITKAQPCRGAPMPVKSVEVQASSRLCGVEIRRVMARVSSSLNDGSKLRTSPKVFMELCGVTLI